jgi:hypothetical protein
VKDEAGSEAVFDNPGMMLRPTCAADATGVNSTIRIRVMDRNTSHDVKIGEIEVNIAPLMWDKWKAIDFDILDKNNNKSGEITIVLMLQSRMHLSKMDNLIMSKPKIKLLVSLVECTQLKSMRRVPTSKNDVFFEASWDNVATFKSDILIGAGSQAVFIPTTEGEIMLQPSAGTLPKTSQIHFQVFDSSNFRAPKLIGMTDIDVSPLALDTEKQFESDIFDIAGHVTGHIMFKSMLTTKNVSSVSAMRKRVVVDRGSLWKRITSKESIEVVEKSGWHKSSTAIKDSIWFERTNFQVLVANIVILLLAVFHTAVRIICYFGKFNFSIVRSYFALSWFLSSVVGLEYVLLVFVIVSIPRLLGYAAGLFLHSFMSQTHKYSGQWDIHVGYISLVVLLDKVQVTAHNVMWRNHATFSQTPVSV